MIIASSKNNSIQKVPVAGIPLIFNSINEFFLTITKHPHLCKSCGMCAGICPTNAVEMIKNSYQQYIPLFDLEKCIDCRKCIHACPGIDITEYKNSLIGEFNKIYIAWSTNEKFRVTGSSGGVITALSSWMLQEKIALKAIMLNSKKSPLSPKIAIATSEKDIMDCSGSKYVAYPICNMVSSFDHNSIITTLPCQSLALKKAKKTSGFIFGLFCSKAFTSDLIKFICDKESIDLKEIINLNYRAGDWPGFVSITTARKAIQIPYSRSYYAAAANGYYFAIQGCLLCPDYFNEYSDISFGDPWGFKIDTELKKGKTLVITRSLKGQALIDRAITDNIICAEEITRWELIKGHKFGLHFKKYSIDSRFKIFLENELPLPKSNIKISDDPNFLNKVLQKYYFKNNVQFKSNYSRIFKYQKWSIFLKRYFFHLIQTLIFKLFPNKFFKDIHNQNG